MCLYSALRLQRAKPALSHIFIYRAVSYFRLELSRFTSFPVYVLAPSSFQNWIMFSDSPHGDALSYSNRSADSSLPASRPANIDFHGKNPPRCPTNISYGFASQKISSPMLSLVGARSYHPLAFDFNTAASAMNFYNRALPPHRVEMYL